jgi:hypothetical protein
MLMSLHVKYPIFASDFNETFFCQQAFRKLFAMQISWKSDVSGGGAELFRADGQTDITEANIIFSQFCERA